MPPIYQYECTSIDKVLKKLEKAKPGQKVKLKRCGHKFEVFYQNQSAVEREEPIEACPKCGGIRKERLVSTGTSFILKGPGWTGKIKRS